MWILVAWGGGKLEVQRGKLGASVGGRSSFSFIAPSNPYPHGWGALPRGQPLSMALHGWPQRQMTSFAFVSR